MDITRRQFLTRSVALPAAIAAYVTLPDEPTTTAVTAEDLYRLSLEKDRTEVLLYDLNDWTGLPVTPNGGDMVMADFQADFARQMRLISRDTERRFLREPIEAYPDRMRVS